MNKLYQTVLLALIAIILLVTIVSSNAFPQYADHFGAPGKIYTIPVYIEDTYVPINSMIFSVSYDKTKVKLVGVINGNLTKNFDAPIFYCPKKGICNIAMVYDGITPMPVNSTGDICVLKFRTVGSRTLIPTELAFSNVQLSDTNYTVGTAPTVNGTISTIPDIEEHTAYWS